MKLRLLAAALALGSTLTTSCSKQSEQYTTAQGSVGATKDDALVFAADTDTDQLYVFDTTTEKLIAAVKTGASPEKVLVGKDDTLYVTNRMGRSVSVIRRGDWKEAARLDVGVEPVALGLSADGKTLYVVSSTSLTSAEFGVLTAIDTATLSTKWELPVGHEPRGLALLDGDRAMVTLFKDGDVAMVDLSVPKVLKSSTDVLARLNPPVQNGQSLPTPLLPSVLRPRGLESLAVSPDGRQVYATAHLSSDAVLLQEDVIFDGGFEGSGPGGGGSGYGTSTCGSTAVSSPALLSFDSNANPLVDDLIGCSIPNSDHPPTMLNSGNPTIPIQGPRAAVVDPAGAFVFVVNHDSNNLAVVATTQSGSQKGNFNGQRFGGSVQSIVSVGAGPTGIALTKGGTVAWVYNGFDHSMSRIESVNGTLRTTKTVTLGADVLPVDVVAGRKLFFSTTDARMNDLGVGLSCGTCHLDGREDGHVWNFTTGPRQTPTLAGRMLEKTEPLHWDGEFSNMGNLSQAITGRMGGHGITAEMTKQISAYLASLPAADNPHRLVEKTPAQLRGAQVFTKAQCSSCHASETLTNNGFADVGTLVLSGTVLDDRNRLSKGLNTPSLLGLARTAPYLHDGSALTIKERILRGKADDKHGLTSKLSPAEVDDLVAYLQTL